MAANFGGDRRKKVTDPFCPRPRSVPRAVQAVVRNWFKTSAGKQSSGGISYRPTPSLSQNSHLVQCDPAPAGNVTIQGNATSTDFDTRCHSQELTFATHPFFVVERLHLGLRGIKVSFTRRRLESRARLACTTAECKTSFHHSCVRRRYVASRAAYNRLVDSVRGIDPLDTAET